MLKLAFLSTVACLFLAGLPQETRGGMIPSIRHDKQFFYYHMYTKAVGRCYGDDVIKEYDDQLRLFFNKCTVISLLEKESSAKNTSVGNDDGKATADGNATTTPATAEDSSPFFPAEIIRAIKNNVFGWSQLVECIFDNYNITTYENGTVDGSNYIALYKENPNITEELKSFLIPLLKDCERKSVFGDYMMWGEKYADLHKMVKFFRCTSKEIYGACIKQDLKNSASEYDLLGLDGELSDVDDITRRYFVASSYANWDRTGLWDDII